MDKEESQLGIITFVRIPPKLRKRIDDLAAAETRTVSGQIIVLLRKALEPDYSTETPKPAPKRQKVGA